VVFPPEVQALERRRKKQRITFTARGLVISKLILLISRMTNPRR